MRALALAAAFALSGCVGLVTDGDQTTVITPVGVFSDPGEGAEG